MGRLAVVIDTQNKSILFLQTVINVILGKGLVTDAEIKAALEKFESAASNSDISTEAQVATSAKVPVEPAQA